ncbi:MULTISPECIES: polysaccharide lyase family 1 protein [Sorangium]|uniref:Pectate lyase n=1 Tax=Sorangium cellulosum TaxID=56 RepID=A0A4P2QGQ4_SORCE|nr:MULTISPECIES: pectate lyase [Sorangium]AUX28766.1 pectate lyase [Sorangium cellulosum]WCQ88163.1 pectate lyase [Sorangium sp. Soce836]
MKRLSDLSRGVMLRASSATPAVLLVLAALVTPACGDGGGSPPGSGAAGAPGDGGAGSVGGGGSSSITGVASSGGAAGEGGATVAGSGGSSGDGAPAGGGSAASGAGGGGAPPSGEVLAFPGAQGFGRHAVGGRGGDVVHVTNLNDSGAGSLRDAISQPNRTVVFDVGGVIEISSRLVFKSNQTIAGQTAPGGGITIYGNGTSFSGASNTIVRFVRFRMGAGGDSGKDTVTMANGHDVIWDHCSLSWGRDGTFDLNQESGAELYNLTLQDSIVAQGLQSHSTGGLVNTAGTSIIRSLYIDNNSRNPKARGTLQFVNNVVYNWVVSGYILGDTSGRSDGSMLGNYFITGPETRGGTLDSPTPAYNLYADGNYYDSDKDGTLDGRLLGKGDFGTVTWLDAPSVEFPDVPAMTAQEAYAYVSAHAGASIHRDEADRYVLDELASLGKRGATISNESSLGFANGVGALPGGSAPSDADRDGMPDAWERARDLDPANADDRNGDRDGDGYTNLEEYLSSLVP